MDTDGYIEEVTSKEEIMGDFTLLFLSLCVITFQAELWGR